MNLLLIIEQELDGFQTPKSKSNLIKTFPCQNILYLSTSGLRFYAQEPKDLKDYHHNTVSDEIIKSFK